MVLEQLFNDWQIVGQYLTSLGAQVRLSSSQPTHQLIEHRRVGSQVSQRSLQLTTALVRPRRHLVPARLRKHHTFLQMLCYVMERISFRCRNVTK